MQRGYVSERNSLFYVFRAEMLQAGEISGRKQLELVGELLNYSRAAVAESRVQFEYPEEWKLPPLEADTR
jgi:hypothetical protein